jgi:hypothetical protein
MEHSHIEEICLEVAEAALRNRSLSSLKRFGGMSAKRRRPPLSRPVRGIPPGRKNGTFPFQDVLIAFSPQ